MVGVLAATVSTLAIGLAPSYAFLLLVTVVGAIGRAAVQPVAQATVAVHFPDEAARRSRDESRPDGELGCRHHRHPAADLPSPRSRAGGWRS